MHLLCFHFEGLALLELGDANRVSLAYNTSEEGKGPTSLNAEQVSYVSDANRVVVPFMLRMLTPCPVRSLLVPRDLLIHGQPLRW